MPIISVSSMLYIYFPMLQKKKKSQMSASYSGCPQEFNILLKVTCISLFSIKMLF